MKLKSRTTTNLNSDELHEERLNDSMSYSTIQNVDHMATLLRYDLKQVQIDIESNTGGSEPKI